MSSGASKKIIEEIRAATKASEEDIKAMLQVHEGDANAAILALLDSPFQKVDGKKHKPAAAAPTYHTGSRDRNAPPRRDAYTSSSGRGGRGGRGEGGETRMLGGRGGAAPSPAGRGRGSSVTREYTNPSRNDNGYHSADAAQPGLGSTSSVEPSLSSGPAVPGGAWGVGPSVSSNAAAPSPPSGAWGAGSRTIAERIKARQVPAAPAPAYQATKIPASVPVEEELQPEVHQEEDFPSYPYPAGEYAEEGDGEYAPEPVVEPEDEFQPDTTSLDVPAPAPSPPSAPVQQPTWSNADVAKNLLHSLTKGGAAAALQPQAQPASTAAALSQPQPQTAQQAAQAHQASVAAAQDQALSSADSALNAPPPTHGSYTSYSSVPAAKVTTAAELEAQMQLSFGNFGLGDFTTTFGNYNEPTGPPSSDHMPIAQPAPEPAATATAAAQQDTYKPAPYNGFGGYGSSDTVAPQPQVQMSAAPPAPEPKKHISPAAPSAPAPAPAPAPSASSFSNFAQTAGGSGGFGAAFGSNFSAPEPSGQAHQYNAGHQAFVNYAQEPLKQQQQPSSHGHVAPGMMSPYSMQVPQQHQHQQQPYLQQQHHQQQPSVSAYPHAAASKPMYPSSYSQSAAPPQPGAMTDLSASAVSNAAAAIPSGGGSAAGVAPSGVAGVPHQMHFSNPQVAAAAAAGVAAPGMAPYNAAALYSNPYPPQFSAPYMGYNNYNMPYGYQGAYPPQAASAYAPNASAAYAVPHSQHSGPRTQHSYNPYSHPTQGGGPGAQAAPAGYGTAGQAAAYGLPGYDDMSSTGAGPGGVSSYGAKDKDTNMYGQQGVGYNSSQHPRGNTYGGGYQSQNYPGQSYGQQPKGNYGGGGYNRQQYGNQQQQQQQQYGSAGGHGGQSGGGGYSKAL